MRAESIQEILLSISNDIAATRNKNELFVILVEKIRKIIPFNDIVMTTFNKEKNAHRNWIYYYEARRRTDPDFDYYMQAHHPVNDGVLNLLMDVDHPIIFDLDELIEKGNCPPYIYSYKSDGIEQFAGVIMRNGEIEIGGLFFTSELKNNLTEEHLKLMKALSSQLCIAAANILAIEEIAVREQEKSLLLIQQDEIKSQNNSLMKLNSTLHEMNIKQKKLLSEKEWLLKEIHHRVKNNLQIVISLLNTQSGSLHNEEAIAAIRESQHRMHSISLVHQRLYQSENLAFVDMYEYINELSRYLQDSFDPEKLIDVVLETEPIELDISHAVPIGLILNEAITNAMKYAFCVQRTGRVVISLDQDNDGTILLKVADNGQGLPEGFDVNVSTSLGMSLMKGLTQQLEGEFKLINIGGLTVQIIVPGEELKS
jgi:two-component sensor histidine kinase